MKRATDLAKSIRHSTGSKRTRAEWERNVAEAEEVLAMMAPVVARAEAGTNMTTFKLALNAQKELQLAAKDAEIAAKDAEIAAKDAEKVAAVAAKAIEKDVESAEVLARVDLVSLARRATGELFRQSRDTGQVVSPQALRVAGVWPIDAELTDRLLAMPTDDAKAEAMSALWDDELAKYARRLATYVPNERVEVERRGNPVSVQQLMRHIVQSVIRARRLNRVWAWEVELATVFEAKWLGAEFHQFFLGRADGVLLLGTDRHANLVTALVTDENKKFLIGAALIEGVEQGLQYAAMRLMHLVSLRRERYGDKWWTADAGPLLVAYSTVADGFTLYVLCVEVVVVDGKPLVKWRISAPLPLWGDKFMDAATNAMGGGAYDGPVIPGGPRANQQRQPGAAPPEPSKAPAGLVVLLALLSAERDVLGPVPYVLPPGLSFHACVAGVGGSSEYPMPPVDTWQHLGSGGASEAYQVRVESGQFLVVKVSRHPANTQQSLSNEREKYELLGAGCLAIPQLVAVAYAGERAAAAGAGAGGAAAGAAAGAGAGAAAARKQLVAAMVLTPGDGVYSTLPVWDVLSSVQAGFHRTAYALFAVYSVAVALAYARSKRLMHTDVRLHNVVWIVRSNAAELTPTSSAEAVLAAAVADALPSVENVAAAKGTIGTTEDAAMDAARLHDELPVHAQLVDWGVAMGYTQGNSDTPSLWALLAAFVSDAPRDTVTEATSKSKTRPKLSHETPATVTTVLTAMQAPEPLKRELRPLLDALLAPALRLNTATRAILDILACVLRAKDVWIAADTSRAEAAATAAVSAEAAMAAAARAAEAAAAAAGVPAGVAAAAAAAAAAEPVVGEGAGAVADAAAAAGASPGGGRAQRPAAAAAMAALRAPAGR